MCGGLSSAAGAASRPVVVRDFPSNALRAKAIREVQVNDGGNGRGVVLLTSAGATGRGGPPDPGLGRWVAGLLRAPGKEARAGRPGSPGIPPGRPRHSREFPRAPSFDLSPPPS